jgi:hypothetical protein
VSDPTAPPLEDYGVGTWQCARAGCLNDAFWQVNWRNPRIHTLARIKVWVACDEHVEFLRDYLDSRGFPVVVTPLGTYPDALPPVPGS